MIRIFLPPEKLSSDQLIITGEQAKHLSVLRVNPGEYVHVLDGHGYKYKCRVLSAHKREVSMTIIMKEPYSVESPLSITLAQGIPKSDKMDLVIQKSTELGAGKIIPLITERSQVRYTHKVDRWRKISLSSSQQSGRDMIPEISEPLGFIQFLDKLNLPSSSLTKGESGGLLKIIFSGEHEESNLKKVLRSFGKTKQITLLVGPEGGFSKDEVSAAVKKGFIKVSLGPRILRTETAPLAAISIIQYELGDMG